MNKLLATTAALLMLAGPAYAANGGASLNSNSLSIAKSIAAAQANNHNSVRNSVSNQNANNNIASANNAGNNQSMRYNEKYQAPGVAAAGLAATGTCPIGSVSFGVSGPGAGLSFGFTRGDTDCRDLYLIQQAGFHHSALVMQQYLLDQNPRIASAYRKVFPNNK